MVEELAWRTGGEAAVYVAMAPCSFLQPLFNMTLPKGH